MRYISIIIMAFSLMISTVNAQENNKTVEFTLSTPNKGDIHIQEVKGGMLFKEMSDKVVVLSFIAYNGKPCLNLIKILNSMKKEHKDFDAFAVEMRGLSGDKLKAFVKEKDIDFSIIGYEKAKDFTNYVARNAGWNGTMPFILIIDKKGAVKYMQIGLVPKEGFEKAYKELK